MRYFITLLFFYTLMQTYAEAYLDPATGSLILQYIIAGIAAVASTASFFWNKIRNFFVKRILKKEVKEESSKKTNINK